MSLSVLRVPVDLSLGKLDMNSEQAFVEYFETLLPLGKVDRVVLRPSRPLRDGTDTVSATVFFSSWDETSATYLDFTKVLDKEGNVIMYGSHITRKVFRRKMIPGLLQYVTIRR
jgi:hypothetical protein